MRRSLGFQQQCHGDNGMWMETQAQEQSYAFHEESWSSDNNYQKHFPGMPMKKHGHGAFAMAMDSEFPKSKQHNNFGGGYDMGMGMHGGHGHGFGYAHGGGNKFPFGGTNASHHHFSNGGSKFNSGGHGHQEYFVEESEYEAYAEEHVGGVRARVDEMRYERHNNWGGDRNMNYWKPHGHGIGGHKAEWAAKGV